ncbi:hypothetical protein PT7_0784 [Pusillimonas sp. T7-7]|uniref:flagellar hook-length control protein FliK n=1 Tax=Pusillimonas sp. (strain T7-7) TaxID=1007105 RepID=UPI000208486D|nr:flagellar hook-length control protein FliK [Pusillimonas sp. T7-7]AEC19324.1 hypothetical protein PT7_0784 [Pusillimonas sp. T7-7]
MNMPAIAAVLPSTLTATSGARGAGHGEPDAEAARFSNVLARQHGTEAGSSAVQAPGKKTEGKPDKAGDQTAEQAAADEALARTAGEQAMALPQIALHIAAEVAAVQQTSTTGRKLLADKSGAALIHEGITADTAGKASVARGVTPLASLISKAIDSNAAKPVTADGPPPSVVSATPMIEPVDSGDQAIATASPLSARQAAGMAGAKQAVLAMQTRMQAGEASPDAVALADFLASKAQAAQAQESTTPASPVDLASVASTVSHGYMATSMASGAHLPGVSPAGAPGALFAVATPLGNPNWSADFSRQFVSIAQGANNMPHTAELRLDPPELGPLRISINISDNTATAIFVSPHAAVRQTVENALPQLQQQLAQAGISLGQTSVSDHGQSDQAAHQSSASGGHGSTGKGGVAATAGDSGAALAMARSTASNALVDTFA